MNDIDKPGKRLDAAGYWRANVRILSILLPVWFASGCLLSIVFVDRLNEFQVGGFPLGFWFAQQGTIVVFIVLILIYSLWMGRLDRRYGRRGKE